jgi:hypothetical protein
MRAVTRSVEMVVVALTVAAFVITSSTLSAVAAPASGCAWNGTRYVCSTTIGHGGGGGSATTSAGTSGELTVGAKVCRRDGARVPCATKSGAFSDSSDCAGYVTLTDPQPAPPAGDVAGSGAWYTCTYDCVALTTDGGNGCAGGIAGLGYWSVTPPPGVGRYTPAQAAAALARTFRLAPITIGMAPADKTHTDDPAGTAAYRRTWVGIPVWLWVERPAPLTYGPYQQTATLGQVTVTATATVSSVTWSSGDGQTVNCGAGTAFDEAATANEVAQDSPTCGFRYQHSSTAQPGRTWTVTATSHWTVVWTGGGQTGTIQVANLTAETPVRVGELQAVNDPVTRTELDGHR